MVARMVSILLMVLACVVLILGYDLLVGFERGALLDTGAEALADALGYGEVTQPGGRGVLNAPALRPYGLWDLRYVIALLAGVLLLSYFEWVFGLIARLTGRLTGRSG